MRKNERKRKERNKKKGEIYGVKNMRNGKGGGGNEAKGIESIKTSL